MNYSLWVFWFISLSVKFANLQYSGSFDTLNCPGLPDRTQSNVQLECLNRSELVTDCSYGMPHGSTANYSCPKYFKSSTPNLSGGVILCVKAEWQFYSEFLRFSCVAACGQWLQKESTVKVPPWHVEIFNRQHRMMGKCQGTLIPSLVGNASTVLTSRSCLTKVGGKEAISRLSAIIGQSVIKYQIGTVFFTDSQRYDIAILRLSQPVAELSDNVLPICMTPYEQLHNEDKNKVNEPGPGANGLVFGMERSSNADNRINLTTLSSESCRILGFNTKEDEFCALKTDSNESTCSDIFQPFLIDTSSTYHILGIPKGTLRINSCPHHGIVYTKISSHRHWIQETLRHFSLRPFKVPKAPLSDDNTK